MNTKKITKIISVLLIVATILSAFSMVFADNTVSIPSAVQLTSGTSDVQNVAGRIIFIVQLICYAAAVIMLMMLGIKFVTASPEGKAEIKKSAIIYVIGAVMVFAAGLLIGIIQNVATGIAG